MNPFSRTDFTGQGVLITGASSGIGEAMAREFATKGAELILLARRSDRLKILCDEIIRQGGKAVSFVCDVRKESDLTEVMEMLRRDGRKIDVVVANAGFGVVGSFQRLTVEDFRNQFETNVFGVIRTLKETLPDVLKTRGRLAAVGSVNGYVALSGNAPYCTSKFAIRALCTSLQLELRDRGVSVTHIAPGFVTSEIRHVNNQGQFRPNAKDPVPQWIQMPAKTAARKIVRSIFLRKSERLVTAHAYGIVWLQRHFPCVLNALLHLFKVEARDEV